MSFLTAIPQELQSVSTRLASITTSLTAQNLGAAVPTTTIIPAASDPVSAQQAGIFSAYGTLYQQIAAEAQTVQEQYASMLGTSATTYSAAEDANASAAALPEGGGLLDFLSYLFGGPVGTSAPGLGGPFGLSGNLANIFNIGGGNYASACSDLLGLAGGGLLPTDSGDIAAAAGAADAVSVTAPAGGAGFMPAGAMGGATMVGRLSAPPVWAGAVPAGPAVTPIQTVGMTTAAPSAGTGGIIPGMPGMAGAGRNSAGFGAPRYGVKPIVMPKVTAV